MSDSLSTTPNISVVVPCKNEGTLLCRAVESILKQDVEATTEVIIVDDGTTDQSTATVQRTLSDRPQVYVIPNERAPGPSGARNTGIRKARGEWIAFLDADDVLLPESLERRWSVAVGRSKVQFVAGDFIERSVDGSERRWVPRFRGLSRAARTIDRLESARGVDTCVRLTRPASLLAHVELVWTGTVLVRKSLLQALGGFNESLLKGEDTNMWIRLGATADLYFVPVELARYCRRKGSITKTPGPQGKEGRRAIHLLLENPLLRDHRPALLERLARMNNRLMWHYREHDRPGKALHAALQAIRCQPTKWLYWRNLLGTLVGR